MSIVYDGEICITWMEKNWNFLHTKDSPSSFLHSFSSSFLTLLLLLRIWLSDSYMIQYVLSHDRWNIFLEDFLHFCDSFRFSLVTLSFLLEAKCRKMYAFIFFALVSLRTQLFIFQRSCSLSHAISSIRVNISSFFSLLSFLLLFLFLFLSFFLEL